jgi:hypothetical protein
VSAAATIRLHYPNKLAAGSVRVKRTERERPSGTALSNGTLLYLAGQMSMFTFEVPSHESVEIAG